MNVSREHLRAARDRHETSTEPDTSPNPILEWDGEAFDLQLDEDARRLLSNLQEGSGEHSESLDLGLIDSSFRNLLKWASAPIIDGLCRENALMRRKLDAADREVVHLERVLALARGEK
jgi:hypothetical protein